VPPGERAPLAWSFAYFFLLLCGYYILRPLRDEMGIQGGVQALPWVFTATLLAMLAAVPLFGWACARLPRRRLLPAVYGFFLLNLLAFFAAFRAGIDPEWTARAFFVWVSVYNLFVVSVFWSFMVDLYDREQAKRLFGFIAAGGSAGALVGPALTAALARPLGTLNLLLVSAAFLALATLCIFRLLVWSAGKQGAPSPAREAPLGGGAWSGVREVAGSPYLLGIAAYMVVYTVLSTFLYFQQARLVADSGLASEARTSLFASMDLAVNLLALAGQTFVTARLIRRWGVAMVLALVPALTFAGFGVLALFPVLAVAVGFQVLRRAADFALARPARELLYTAVEREAKYKAKNFIDTVVYRSGDAVGGWAFAGLKALGLGLAGIAWVAVPLAALWIALSVALGRRQAALARQENPHAETRS
jgi:AAA family ATP:ADP antiporter